MNNVQQRITSMCGKQGKKLTAHYFHINGTQSQQPIYSKYSPIDPRNARQKKEHSQYNCLRFQRIVSVLPGQSILHTEISFFYLVSQCLNQQRLNAEKLPWLQRVSIHYCCVMPIRLPMILQSEGRLSTCPALILDIRFLIG